MRIERCAIPNRATLLQERENHIPPFGKIERRDWPEGLPQTRNRDGAPPLPVRLRCASTRSSRGEDTGEGGCFIKLFRPHAPGSSVQFNAKTQRRRGAKEFPAGLAAWRLCAFALKIVTIYSSDLTPAKPNPSPAFHLRCASARRVCIRPEEKLD